MRRCDHDAFAGMNAQRIEVFHVTNRNTVVETVANHLVFYFFPAFDRFFDQNLGRIGESFGCQRFQFLVVCTETASKSAQRVSSANDNRITNDFDGFVSLFHIYTGNASGSFDINFGQFPGENLTVFGVNNRLNRRSNHFHLVFIQNSIFEKGNPAIEGSLTSKSQQNSVRFFLDDNLFNKEWSHGKKINPVGNIFRSLDRCNIRINQDGFHILFLQRFQGLRS